MQYEGSGLFIHDISRCTRDGTPPRFYLTTRTLLAGWELLPPRGYTPRHRLGRHPECEYTCQICQIRHYIEIYAGQGSLPPLLPDPTSHPGTHGSFTNMISWRQWGNSICSLEKMHETVNLAAGDPQPARHVIHLHIPPCVGGIS